MALIVLKKAHKKAATVMRPGSTRVAANH